MSLSWPGVRRGAIRRDHQLPFPLPGAGNVVGRLHPHQGVHLDSERLLDAQRHEAGQIGPAIQKRGQCDVTVYESQGRLGRERPIVGHFHQDMVKGVDG